MLELDTFLTIFCYESLNDLDHWWNNVFPGVPPVFAHCSGQEDKVCYERHQVIFKGNVGLRDLSFAG